MTSCDELLGILSQNLLENTKIEFKLSKFLTESQGRENQKQICFSLIALANREGGKLIFGIKDNGKFEGKNIFNNIDDLIGVITNLCYNNISPVIQSDIEFVSCNEGDIIIVNVPCRIDIPHAYIKRKGPEIYSRVYYLRTSHGKRLVNDGELKQLFSSEVDPVAALEEFQKRADKLQTEIPEIRGQLNVLTNDIQNGFQLDENGRTPGSGYFHESFLFKQYIDHCQQLKQVENGLRSKILASYGKRDTHALDKLMERLFSLLSIKKRQPLDLKDYNKVGTTTELVSMVSRQHHRIKIEPRFFQPDARLSYNYLAVSLMNDFVQLIWYLQRTLDKLDKLLSDKYERAKYFE